MALKVEILSGRNLVQQGIYVSLINLRNPKPHQFALLPELINGVESNFIGVTYYAGVSPDAIATTLEEQLAAAKGAETELTYFTDRLNTHQLQQIEEANAIHWQHGRSEDEYGQAEAVLDRLHQKTATFRVLDYRCEKDAAIPGQLRLTYLKFVFDLAKAKP